jgi:hypothetical protein
MNDLLEEEKQADEARRKALHAQELDRLALGQVFQTAAGRRFLCRLFQRAGVFEKTFTGEALTGSYNEGLRWLGTEVFRDLLAVEPNAHPIIVSETKRIEEETKTYE